MSTSREYVRIQCSGCNATVVVPAEEVPSVTVLGDFVRWDPRCPCPGCAASGVTFRIVAPHPEADATGSATGATSTTHTHQAPPQSAFSPPFPQPGIPPPIPPPPPSQAKTTRSAAEPRVGHSLPDKTAQAREQYRLVLVEGIDEQFGAVAKVLKDAGYPEPFATSDRPFPGPWEIMMCVDDLLAPAQEARLLAANLAWMTAYDHWESAMRAGDAKASDNLETFLDTCASMVE